jgi:cobalamin biosynthesis Mg chelatase CobN
MAKQGPFFAPRRSGTTRTQQQQQVTEVTETVDQSAVTVGPEPKLTQAQVEQDNKDSRSFMMILGIITLLILVILYFIFNAAVGG